MVLRDPVPEEAAAETPLFRWFASGAALTGQQLHMWVRSMMERIGECPVEYGTHSLRIGGATSLADAKCPDRIIQTIGRWSSECYRLYCRESFREVIQWVTRMGEHHTTVVGRGRRAVSSMLPGLRAGRK